jgi:hypothetical protein
MSTRPVIRSVEALAPYLLKISWRAGIHAGKTITIDFANQVMRLDMMAPYRSQSGWQRVHIIDNGKAIAWDCDGLSDTPASVLERLCTHQAQPAAA